MKTFNEFGKLMSKMTCSNAIIELRFASKLDGKPLYRVIEYPNNKSAKWELEIKYFDYSKEANEEFIKKCEYWLI